MSTQSERVDLLAVVAHPDDAELLCGGTLLRAADAGHRTGILNLTGGETGSRGDAAQREEEAGRAAEILGLSRRVTAGLSDGALEATPDARNVVAALLRELRPRTVILHGPGGRHPDHHAARELGRAACFAAGLSRAPVPGEPFRPAKILYALSYLETHVRPTFVVDITAQIDRKLAAVAAYGSQFEGKTWAGDVFGGETRPLLEQLRVHAAHYGSWIRRDYGEPYWTEETLEVDDVVSLAVRSL